MWRYDHRERFDATISCADISMAASYEEYGFVLSNPISCVWSELLLAELSANQKGNAVSGRFRLVADVRHRRGLRGGVPRSCHSGNAAAIGLYSHS